GRQTRPAEGDPGALAGSRRVSAAPRPALKVIPKRPGDTERSGEEHGGETNDRAFEHAKTLIGEGKVVVDDRDAWSEHQPSAEQDNDFIRRHGFHEYGKCIWKSMTRRTRTPRADTSSR